MTTEEITARLDELEVLIPNEPDILVKLDMVQERNDLRAELGSVSR